MSSENSVLSAKRENAARVLREILERMGIEAEVSAFDDGERVILDAHGPESGLVIGKKGATLDALQYLINRIVSKKPSDGPGVVVDAEGYRGRREDALTDLAQRLAEKAVKTGRPVPVEPMNPARSADHPRRAGRARGRADRVGRRRTVSPSRDLPAQPPDLVGLAARPRTGGAGREEAQRARLRGRPSASRAGAGPKRARPGRGPLPGR